MYYKEKKCPNCNSTNYEIYLSEEDRMSLEKKENPEIDCLNCKWQGFFKEMKEL